MRKINLLLSCPSDVFSNFGNDIFEAVTDVNFYFEKILDTHIELLHYSSSSYSQVGKPAQDHLDDTLIINSDACIAFFYHKLGTPTSKYKSGTDEEINLMRSQGKHVSLFRIYDSNDDKNFDSELDRYFKDISAVSMFKTIIGKEKIIDTVKIDLVNFITSTFNVELLMMGEPIEPIKFFKKIAHISDKKKEIENLINKINKLSSKRDETIRMVKETSKEIKEEICKSLSGKMYSDILQNVPAIPAVPENFLRSEVVFNDIFDEDSVNLLNRFKENNNIEILDSFLSFQEEKVYRSNVMLDTSLLLDGCAIKDKVLCLQELSDNLKIYFAWLTYLKEWKNLILIPLAIFNNSVSYQESINIKLKVKKRYFKNFYQLVPNELISFNIYGIGIDKFLNPYNKYAGYEEFSYPPKMLESYNSSIFGTSIDYAKSIENMFNEMFQYEIENTIDEVTIKTVFNNVNAGEKHCFPTYLILNKNIKNIYYEIFGSALPRKISGKIEVKKK